MLRDSMLVLLCAVLAYGLVLLAQWPGTACMATAGEVGTPFGWIVGTRC